MNKNPRQQKARPQALSEKVYQALKRDLFEFRRLPGDHFSENEIAAQLDVSRTPVRQALFWLEREGFVEVNFRSGWSVKPFDFQYFEQLYDLRTVLECEAVARLCQHSSAESQQMLADLVDFWIDQPPLTQGKFVSEQDELFHLSLIASTGNQEMVRIHRDITERIRIIRHLDFSRDDRIAATYHEHGLILTSIFRQQTEEAQRILKHHIAVSKAEVRKITLHRLQQARIQADDLPLSYI